MESKSRGGAGGGFSGWTAQDIKTIMSLKQDEYTEEKSVSVFCGTWNVNAKKPKEALGDWLVQKALKEPDVYAIGLQEVVDLNGANLVVTSVKSIEPWLEQIKECIGQQYKIICFKQLVGIFLVVYVRAELFEHVSESFYDTVGVGVMGVGGNKGAVAIRFKLYNSSICFVCSHLAAHQHNVQGRNSDFHNISQRLKFEGRVIDIRDHDYLFWLGDLNYRIDVEDAWDDSWFDRMNTTEGINTLLQMDQLNNERASGNVFDGYLEGKIDFKPSYKYQAGTDEYERRPEKKFRIPAWCDRILWTGKSVEQLSYFRSELKTSDHKPVGALFKVMVKVIVKEKEREIYNLLIRQRDDLENDSIAKVQFSESQIDFGSVFYDKPIKKTVSVINNGKVIAKYHFAPKIHESHYSKSWLTVDPPQGFLFPNQKQDIRLVVHVNKDTAAKLNCGKDVLEDILIFRLENGLHYFLSISGQYQKTCFGSPVEFLVRVPTPVRYYQPDHFVESSSKILSIPKELWRMVDHIFHQGITEKNLFTTGGSSVEIESIREALDTGESFPPEASIHSMAEAMIQFLESLPSPIYPLSLCAQYDEREPIDSFARQSLLQLPLLHYNMFLYTISFFRELLRHHPQEISATSLARTLVSSALVHANPLENPQHYKSALLMAHFLTATDL
jgi:phosphatidylinositol-bisphosphatase